MTEASHHRIDVALASYNGGPYLAEMLDSIAAQDHPNMRVLLSDDGSNDDTLAIARRYAETMALTLLDGPPRKGVLRNFEAALAATDAPYIALCDQDDYWMPDKLSTLLARMQSLEALHGATTPILVFSDIEVVDQVLETIRPSIYQGSIKTAAARAFEDFFFSSHVPGCAMMVNRALLDLALPFPDVYIHDWWLIQLATLFGHVDYVDRPLIKYRQHGSNAIGLGGGSNPGASRLSKLANPARLLSTRRARWRSQATDIRRMLRALDQRFGTRLPANGRALVEAGLERPNIRRLHALLGGAKIGEWKPDYFAVLYLLARRT